MTRDSWHAQPLAALLDRLEADVNGLSDDEAARRLKRFGPNRLTPPKPVSAAKILLDQLKSVVVALLIAAVVISVLLGDRVEAVAIAVVLAINTLIGFVMEIRARRAMEALLQFDVPRASVLRHGELHMRDAHEIVPGDVVELNPGQHVPADARLIHGADVRTIEAALGALRGAPTGLMIETGIALAVAAVPEALPAVATIALAVGLRRMARRHALVRRLPAVEALGSTTVVCTDKTRTLTSGEMTVVRVWTAAADFDLTGDPAAAPRDARLRRALEAGALASRPQAGAQDGEQQTGDPVDLAMLHAAANAAIDRAAIVRARPALALVPFSAHRKLMASFHRTDGSIVAYVKGAPATVVELCDRASHNDEERSLDERSRRELLDVNAALAAAGLRVLGLASGPVPAAEESALRGLAFAGFVGLMDPPAPGVKETVALLRGAGLRTVMLTGDQRRTAEAVGKQLGVLDAGDHVIDGRELASLSDAELASRLETVGAFSRVSPEHKLTIVKTLQAHGEIVAMLGDGVNDAAALKQADVGVAMGIRGTDVAKEAASIVLQDDRFETIAAAVEEGRVIYDNIRKFVFYLFSCNVAEVFMLLGAAVAGLPLPLQPLQILWLNIVTDTFPALALAMEPGDSDVMKRPPRSPQEAILSWAFLRSVLGYGCLITASTMTAFVWARDDPARSTTVSFMTLALAQVLHLGNARSVDPVLHPARLASNRYALGAIAVSLGLQLAAMYVGPLARVLHVEPLTAADWAVVLTLSVAPAVAGQGIKLARGRRPKRGDSS